MRPTWLDRYPWIRQRLQEHEELLYAPDEADVQPEAAPPVVPLWRPMVLLSSRQMVLLCIIAILLWHALAIALYTGINALWMRVISFLWSCLLLGLLADATRRSLLLRDYWRAMAVWRVGWPLWSIVCILGLLHISFLVVPAAPRNEPQVIHPSPLERGHDFAAGMQYGWLLAQCPPAQEGDALTDHQAFVHHPTTCEDLQRLRRHEE